MQDPNRPAGSPKQVYFENLSNSSETVTWYTTKESVAVLVDYVLDRLALSISQLHQFGEGAAEADDESVVLSVISAPQGAAITIWTRSQTGVARVNRGLTVEHEEMMSALGRGNYVGNAAQAWAIPLKFGRATDTSDWAELYALMDDGEVVSATDWGVSATENTVNSDSPAGIGVTTEVAQECVAQVLSYLRENKHEQPLPGLPYWITDDGIYITVNEHRLKVGLLVHSGYSLTPQLVEAAAAVCRQLRAGHVWLSAGADDDNWCLVWGLKVPLLWLTDETCQQVVYTALESRQSLQETLDDHFREFGGSRVEIDPAERGAAMLMTQGHL